MKFFKTVFFMLLCYAANAQKLTVKSYQLSYKVFEAEAYGNNPYTIHPQLKDQQTYLNDLNNFETNGFRGSPGPQQLKSFYLGMELFKIKTNSWFWKNHTIHIGVQMSTPIEKDNMGLTFLDAIEIRPDSFFIARNELNLKEKKQTIGLHAGIIRYIKIKNSFSVFFGFILQGDYAFKHTYKSSTDSLVTRNAPFLPKRIQQKTYEGKNIFTWQAYIPVGIELKVYKEKVYAQAGLNVGILYSRYYQTVNKHQESNGFVFSLLYKPSKK